MTVTRVCSHAETITHAIPHHRGFPSSSKSDGRLFHKYLPPMRISTWSFNCSMRLASSALSTTTMVPFFHPLTTSFFSSLTETVGYIPTRRSPKTTGSSVANSLSNTVSLPLRWGISTPPNVIGLPLMLIISPTSSRLTWCNLMGGRPSTKSSASQGMMGGCEWVVVCVCVCVRRRTFFCPQK